MWPVPMTMQTFAVLMVGALCGWRLGVATVVAWLALSFELPLLSEFKTLPMVVTTVGYVVAFPFMAAFVGSMAERGWTARIVPAFLILLSADALCFILGVLWLSTCPDPTAPADTIGLSKAIAWGATPFLLGDLIKITLATVLLIGARRIKQR
jgi:biotin transport system substrate-specific component